MAYTVSDIVHNADRFREAYPHWPHAEPEPAAAEAEAEAAGEPEAEAAAG